MKQSTIPLWLVPIANRRPDDDPAALAGFVSQYGLAWAANRGTQTMRKAMFPARPRRRAAAVHPATTASNPRQHADLRGPERRQPAGLFGAEPGRRFAPLRRPARLPGLAQLAADGVRRRPPAPPSPTSCASSAGACTGSRSRASTRPTSSPTSSRRTSSPGAASACTRPRPSQAGRASRTSATGCAASR